jgi:acetyl esterase/lipase
MPAINPDIVARKSLPAVNLTRSVSGVIIRLLYIGHVHIANFRVEISIMGEIRHQLPFHVEMITGIQYGEADGKSLLVDIAYPNETPGMPAPVRMPAVIEVHGGGWEAGQRDIGRGLLMPLQGFFYASIDYRMSHEALFPAQIHDVKAAIRWLRAHADQYNVDPDRIGLWGGSAGGHLVTLAGTSGDVESLEGDCGWPGHSTRVQAVAAVNPPIDMLVPHDDWPWLYTPDGPAERLFGGPVREHSDLVRSASALTYLTAAAPPFLLLHGTTDDIVPFSQAVLFYNALKGLGGDVTLVAFEGIDHALYGHTVQIWDHMLQFFKKHLGQPLNYGEQTVVRIQ